jgi:hypothetical protein
MLNNVGVQVTIDKEGKIKIEYDGFAGDACYKTGDELKGLLARLGVQFAEAQVTPKAEAEAVLPVELSQADTLTQEG